MKPTLFCAAAVTALALAPGAQATVLPPAVVDTAPLQINDIAVAPDGTGAMVYLKADGARLALLKPDGTWAAPTVVDANASEPRVAVGNNGRVLVGYRDGASLNYRLIPSKGAALSAEGTMRTAINATAIGNDWDLDMNPAGVAYAAWTEADVARTNARAWRLEGTTGTGIIGGLQQDPGSESVDVTSNGPDIRVGVDPQGNGGVVFTQNDAQAWFRRLSGVTPSPTFVDVLLPSALGETLSGTYHQHDLDLGANGIAWESANAMYPQGGHVVGVPVTGETAGPGVLLDLHPKDENDNAERPDVALNTTGRGLFAGEPNQKAGVWGGTLSGATASAPQRLDVAEADGGGAEIPAAGIGDSGRGLIAWTRDVKNGAAGPLEVRARVFDGPAMAPAELVLSDPALGEGRIPFSVVNADAAGSTRLGDTAVLIQQDQGGTRSAVIGRYDAPPSAPVGTTSEAPAAEPRPNLTWTAAEAQWSPLTTYRILVDDQEVGTVGPAETSFTPPQPIAAGDHTWRVVAVDALGQETSSPARALPITGGATPTPTPTPGVDRTKPKLTLTITGKRRVGRKLRMRLRATDAGGVARVTLRINKGRARSRASSRLTVYRTFTRRGRVRIRVSATDRAGNVARLSRRLRIKR